MAPQKSPAFQFYARDFLTGVATMSLAERGAYISLLAHQWDSGAVPASAKERARILGCSAAEERRVWAVLVSKFTYINEVFLNERLEEEREKQAEYRRRQSDRGKASAATRRQPEGNAGSTSVATSVQPALQPEPQPEGNSSSAFASSIKDHNTHSARANGHGNGANAPGSLPRDHRFHAICGKKSRICLTDATAAKLADKWGGPPDDAMPFLQAFADALELQIGEGAKGDFLWLTQHFESFMAAKGRLPVAPPPKPKATKDAGVGAAIDAWGRE